MRSALRCLEIAGHLALPVMQATLCEEGVAHLMGDARALYEHHERDAGDTILCAFKAGNWTKVVAPTIPCLGCCDLKSMVSAD